ncbi:MAG: RNA polymerase Rpb4 family protein [Methanobrevibacter sp.]|uniref:RNA polymerase Rpb4 family protein n=1 Tax=uncultured Methanobrevibacter sp. TaxID=253161 RepID=UPI0025CCC1B7|nr:RNA polymerase Rpb4 family protein [uncultured Methanobrevibacter sp.]MEE1128762.1 RNA polymerase Rpb4 family protein [Methanobrevibacter sp.]
MIGKEIIESEAIPSAKVKEILEEFSDDNELNYEQNLTLNHLSRFKRYSVEDSEEIMEKLQEALPNLRTRAIVHIVDLIPKDLADLRLIFAKEPYQPSKEEMEEILEILEQYDIDE